MRGRFADLLAQCCVHCYQPGRKQRPCAGLRNRNCRRVGRRGRIRAVRGENENGRWGNEPGRRRRSMTGNEYRRHGFGANQHGKFRWEHGWRGELGDLRLYRRLEALGPWLQNPSWSFGRRRNLVSATGASEIHPIGDYLFIFGQLQLPAGPVDFVSESVRDVGRLCSLEASQTDAGEVEIIIMQTNDRIARGGLA